MVARACSVAAFVLLFVLAEARAQTAEPIGQCRFDPSALSFDGDARQQARCLLSIDPKQSHAVAQTLLARVGQPFDLTREDVADRLFALGMAEGLTASIALPVSRAGSNSSSQPLAAYFVIHDTSFPRYRGEQFPEDLDVNPYVNDLRRFIGRGAVAHAFINRLGDVFIGHDFAVPWRATKLEGAQGAGAITRGRFLHVELVQPRRTGPDAPDQNVAPNPGFTAAQYRRLAQLYVLASARAGVWLIPAFHTSVDSGFNDAHDDPSNFELVAFDAAIAEIVEPSSAALPTQPNATNSAREGAAALP
jgi:hypothetical protein